MSKTHRTLVFSSIALALTSLHATADQSAGWYYDEELDTIVFTVEGSRSGISSAENRGLPDSANAQQSRSWYYDEQGDTIVFNVPGSRADVPSSTVASSSVMRMAQRDVGWYYDEGFDTVIFNLRRN